MKKKLIGFAVAFTLTMVVAMPSIADTTATGSENQDQYSMDLAQKGLKRKTTAMCILKDMVDSGKNGYGSFVDPSISKLGKVKALDSAVPLGLFLGAKCVVVIPGDKSVGLAGYGLNYGAGVSLCRDEDGNFGEPKFVKLEGGSYGFQVGAKSTDRILLFMNPNAEKTLDEPSVKLGANASAAAGPLGRDAEANLTVDGHLRLQDEVLGYSHLEGLYAGVSLTGAVLKPDTKMTQAVQGEEVSPGLFEKIGHGIGGWFHHKNKHQDPVREQDKKIAEQKALDVCDKAVDLVYDMPGMNAAVNRASAQDAQAVANSSAVMKPQAPAATTGDQDDSDNSSLSGMQSGQLNQ
jgi:lipid-binding SYLF domain-containing protein